MGRDATGVCRAAFMAFVHTLFTRGPVCLLKVTPSLVQVLGQAPVALQPCKRQVVIDNEDSSGIQMSLAGQSKTVVFTGTRENTHTHAENVCYDPQHPAVERSTC